MDKCREAFEKLAITICADHKIWLENHVHFKHGTYVPKDYKNEIYCQHSAYFGFSWIMYEQQQKRIDELELAFKQLIEMENQSISYERDLYDRGWNHAARTTVENIYKLTGLNKKIEKAEND